MACLSANNDGYLTDGSDEFLGKSQPRRRLGNELRFNRVDAEPCTGVSSRRQLLSSPTSQYVLSQYVLISPLPCHNTHILRAYVFDQAAAASIDCDNARTQLTYSAL